jgi:hypothetical protein
VDSAGSDEGTLAGCCECGDEPSGSGATDLVKTKHANNRNIITYAIKIQKGINMPCKQ